MTNERRSGQMLLIVVLTMIVALTVGLSVVARTVTNLRISRQNEESQRAFQAAEAGIQKALESAECGSACTLSDLDSLNSQAKFQTAANSVEGASFLLNGGNNVDQDIGVDVWLSNYPDFSNPLPGTEDINILWWSNDNQSCDGSSPQDTVPVIEVSMLVTVAATSYDINQPQMRKFFFEPCTANPRISGDSPGAGVELLETQFAFSGAIDIADTERALFIKVIPYFNSTKMAISSSVPLPSQGKEIVSTGTSGETARKITYFTSHPQIPPEIFPYSIMTQ